MKFGVHLPQWGASATRSGILDVAKTAEAAGLDSVWVADHIVFPGQSSSRYPYRAEGVPFRRADGFLEASTMLSVVAGATEGIVLGTSVMVLPMREPLLAAKTIATLDVLSGGRTLFAFGAGWWEEEFRAVGAPFARRGRRFDEQIEILRLAWSVGTFSYRGEQYDIDEVTCLPMPQQVGGPRILIGGNGSTALQRAGRLGDGWHAVGADLALLRAGHDTVTQAARARGRDPADLTFSTSCAVGRTDEQILDRLVGLTEIGLSHVVLNFAGASSASETCAAIERFAGSVQPQLRGTVGD